MGAASQIQHGTGGFDMAPAETFYETVGFAFIDDWTANNDEADRQETVQAAGTFSKLSARCSVNTLSTATTTIRFRVDGGNGNQTIAFAAGVTGWVVDSSNSDAMTAGQEANYSFVTDAGGTGIGTFMSVTSVFTATSSHVTTLGGNREAGGLTTASATRFVGFAGEISNGNGNETVCKFQVDATYTLSYLLGNVAVNGRSTNTILKSRKNEADGGQSITIAGATTGIVQDTTNTDSLVAGDDICAAFVTGTGTGTFTLVGTGALLTNSSSSASNIYSASGGSSGRTASGTVTFGPVGGRLYLSEATEANVSVDLNFAAILSKFKIRVTANAYTTDGTARFRVAGGNGNQVLTLTAATTGLFEDTSNSDSVAATDDICFSVVGGTANSLAAEWVSFLVTTTSATAISILDGVAYANVSSVNGVAKASIASINGVA